MPPFLYEFACPCGSVTYVDERGGDLTCARGGCAQDPTQIVVKAHRVDRTEGMGTAAALVRPDWESEPIHA